MRDRNDNVVIICSIENVDPMGVHTGDSVTIAPAQTLTDPLYQELRDQAISVIRAVGVETGGSNIQFAVNPESGEIVVIEMNPRVSRSSALASKATGFPIAKIAAKLAVGYALEEIDNDITGVTPASFEPTIDYVVTKVPAVRVREVPRRRGRADHPHEVGRRGDGDRAHLPRVVREGDALARARLRRPSCPADDDELLERLATPARRPLRPHPRGVPPRARASSEVHERTSIDPWFLRELAGARHRRRRHRGPRPHLPLGRHLRRRVRGAHAVLLLGHERNARRSIGRGPPRRPRVGRHPRLGPEPDRPGDRVRLLLRARGDDRARVGPRRGDDQLQPGDGLDRLRHLRPPLLRAADRRGRARGDRGRAARGRDRPVRRPDAAAAGEGAPGRRRARCSARRSTRSTSPRTAAASAPCCAGSRSPTRPTGPRTRPRRRR